MDRETYEKHQRAKDLSLKIWDFLRENPGFSKRSLPLDLLALVNQELCQCPLCTLFLPRSCVGCPLNLRTFFGKQTRCTQHLYGKWVTYICLNKNKSARYANRIYKKIKAWRIE